MLNVFSAKPQNPCLEKRLKYILAVNEAIVILLYLIVYLLCGKSYILSKKNMFNICIK